MSEDVTIIVTTCNSANVFKLFWKFFLMYTEQPFKMIVVDNGSSDSTLDFLKKCDITIIHNYRNIGVVRALAQAEKLVETKYFVSISDDVIVTHNWLKNLLNAYHSDNQIRSISPIKSGTLIKYPYSDSSCREIWDNIKKSNPNKTPSELLTIYLKDKTFEEFDKDVRTANNFGLQILESPPNFVSGCCVLVETEFIKNIGGFSDTRFNLYGCEDVDRCWRIGTAGFKVARTNDVFVHHLEGIGLKNNNLNWKKLLNENNKKLISKWESVFWNTIRKQINTGKNILEIAKQYWIIEWLLQCVDNTEVPSDLLESVKELKEKTKNHFS